MGKTKADLEQEIAELRETLETRGPVDAPEASPGRSELLPGGGVVRGATLHVAIPQAGYPAAAPKADDNQLALLAASPEGNDFDLGEARALPLTDGGYATARVVRVVQHGEARTVVEVVS